MPSNLQLAFCSVGILSVGILSAHLWSKKSCLLAQLLIDFFVAHVLVNNLTDPHRQKRCEYWEDFD